MNALSTLVSLPEMPSFLCSKFRLFLLTQDASHHFKKSFLSLGFHLDLLVIVGLPLPIIYKDLCSSCCAKNFTKLLPGASEEIPQLVRYCLIFSDAGDMKGNKEEEESNLRLFSRFAFCFPWMLKRENL